MTRVIDILEAVKDLTQKALPNAYVEIDFPDVDKQRKNITVSIVPEDGTLEYITVGSDQCNMNLTLYICVKGDTSANLLQKVWESFELLYKALRNNPTFDGAVNDSSITDYDYFPSLDPSVSAQAITLTLQVQFEKDFTSED